MSEQILVTLYSKLLIIILQGKPIHNIGNENQLDVRFLFFSIKIFLCSF